MIHSISKSDSLQVAEYLSKKLNISFLQALLKTKKIIKSGLTSFIKDGKDLDGVCWLEIKNLNNKKEKFIEIYVNHWKIAESFLQCLRWKLDGEHFFVIPRKDMLNRTYNKAGIKYLKIDGDNHLYTYKFEKREFRNYKSEDLED